MALKSWPTILVLGVMVLAACQSAATSPTQTATLATETSLPTTTPAPTSTATQTPLPSETSPPTETPPASLTPTATPPTFVRENTPIQVPSDPIRAGNAAQLAELARLGKGRIMDVQLSPDRNYLLVQTTIGVYGYLAERQEEAWRFEDPAGIADMALTRTERWMAVATNDGRIALLIYRRGSMFTRWATGYQKIQDLAFSYDGHTLAAIGDQGVMVWSIGETEPLYHYPEMTGEMVRFTPDDEGLIVGDQLVLKFFRLGESPSTPLLANQMHGPPTFSDDGQYITDGLTMWSGETGEYLYTLEGGAAGNSEIVEVAFSLRKSLVAVRDLFMPNVYIYDLESGLLQYYFRSPSTTALSAGSQKLASLSKPGAVSYSSQPSMAFSPNGDFLAVSVSGDLEIWNVRQGTFHQSIHRSGYHIIYRKEYRLHLWDVDVIEQLDPQSGISYHFNDEFLANNLDDRGEYQLYFSSDSQKLFVEDVVWDLKGLRRQSDLQDEIVIGASLIEEKFFTYVGDNKNILSIRSTDTLEELEEIILSQPEGFPEDEPFTFSRPVLSMSGEYLIDVLPLSEGLHPIWYLDENSVGEYYPSGAGQTFLFGAFSADGSILILISTDGSLFIISMKPALELIGNEPGNWNRVFVSNDGQYLVGENGGDGFWLNRINRDASASLTLEKVIKLENIVSPSFACFSPDNQLLAYLDQSQLAVIDLENGRELFRREVSFAEFELTAIAFSPDGKYLATSSYDGTVKLWGIP